MVDAQCWLLIYASHMQRGGSDYDELMTAKKGSIPPDDDRVK